MAMAVITVASGGLPVVDNTAAPIKLGMAVSEVVAVSGVKFGVPVTKVAAGGMPVIFVVPPP